MQNNSIFITFEGGEGVGKTTIIDQLSRCLVVRDSEILFTREPGGVESAEKIRQVILNNQMDAATELLLYAAARNEHYLNKILPALEKNQPVICDRFVDSSVVYQGMVRGLGAENVHKIHEQISWSEPNLTFLIDLSPEIAQERIAKFDRDKNRFDTEDLSFHHKIRDEFLELAQKNRHRFVIIDGSLSLNEIIEQIYAVLNEKFPGKFELKNESSPEFEINPNTKKRILYTDGSASPNPGPGGFAVIENGQPIALGSENPSTNIRMEGLALIEALEILDGSPAEIWTDSEFWINVLTKWAPNWQAKNWKKSGGEIKNLDIVKPLFDLYQKSNAELKWLKGHAGYEYNELADQWANKAREGERLD